MVARIEEKERELSRLKELNARRVEEGKEFLAEVGQKNFIVNMKMDFFYKTKYDQFIVFLLCVQAAKKSIRHIQQCMEAKTRTETKVKRRVGYTSQSSFELGLWFRFQFRLFGAVTVLVFAIFF